MGWWEDKGLVCVCGVGSKTNIVSSTNTVFAFHGFRFRPNKLQRLAINETNR